VKLQWRDVPIGNTVINTSLTGAETDMLQHLATHCAVLEIGSAYGYSTVALGLAAESVTAVDPHYTHGSLPALVENLAANRLLGKTTVWAATSQFVMPRLHDEGLTFDMVWIDGDHTAEVVEHDVIWARKLLRPGGVIACHDYDEDTCPGVKVALDRLYGGPGQLTDTLAVYL
jgi:predicted O-methyltransferase YrrM